MSLKDDLSIIGKTLSTALRLGLELDEIIPLEFAAATEEQYQLLDGTPVKTGDIIQIQDDYCEPDEWKYGKIDCICDSPYWNERGVMCAYVVNLEKEPAFAGYLTVVLR